MNDLEKIGLRTVIKDGIKTADEITRTPNLEKDDKTKYYYWAGQLQAWHEIKSMLSSII
jgi:hypothetical protein